VALGSSASIAAAALWTATVTTTPSYVAAYLPGAILMGIGLGVGIPMMTAASTRDLSPADHAIGAAGNTTLRQIGMALGVAIAVVLADTATGLDGFQAVWIGAGAAFTLATFVFAVRYPNAVANVIDIRELEPAVHPVGAGDVEAARVFAFKIRSDAAAYAQRLTEEAEGELAATRMQAEMILSNARRVHHDLVAEAIAQLWQASYLLGTEAERLENLTAKEPANR